MPFWHAFTCVMNCHTQEKLYRRVRVRSGGYVDGLASQALCITMTSNNGATLLILQIRS